MACLTLLSDGKRQLLHLDFSMRAEPSASEVASEVEEDVDSASLFVET